MAVTTYKYTAGSDPGNVWTNEAYAWDGVDNTNAEYDVPAKEDDENKRLEGETNEAPSSGGTITKVEIGAECHSENSGNVHGRLRAEFNGVAGASYDQWDIPTTEAIRWYDITNDANAPSPWTWADVQNLDARVWIYNSKSYGARWAEVEQIYVRVTYTEGVVYYHGFKIQGEGELALCDVGTNPLRVRKGSTTYGLELVDVSDPNASRVRIKTGAGIKTIRKYT